MIIYATTIDFEPPTTIDVLLSCVARWIGEKQDRRWVDPARLRATVSDRYGREVVEIVSDLDVPDVRRWSLLYTHPDSSVAGRRWSTGIGIMATPDTIRLSLVLETNENSVRVSTAIQASRPRIIGYVLDSAVPMRGTPGLAPIILTDERLLAFRDRIESRSRTAPLVLICPTTDGGYCIEPDALTRTLATLADTVIIPDTLDPQIRTRVLGSYNTWGGAIKIFWPYHRRAEGWESPEGRLILPSELEPLQTPADRVAHVLGIITHRTNIPAYQRHLRIENVRDVMRHRELAARREEAQRTGDMSAYFELLDEADNSYRRQTDELRQERDALQLEVDELEQRLYTERTARESIQLRLDALRNGAVAQEQTQAIRRVISGIQGGQWPTLIETLDTLAFLFPDRIVILESARRSASDSALFRHTDRAFRYLWTLATDYWQTLVDGYGDAQARRLFGDAFAAGESETVQGNTRARQLRTFAYLGQSITMWPHLKIGNNPGVVETWRCHFEWDDERQLIVIGHCGKHLDHK